MTQHPLLAKPLSARPARIRQPIGKQAENRLAPLELLNALLTSVAQTERRSRGLEPLDRPVLGGNKKCMRMPSVGIGECATGRVSDRIAQGEKHLGLRELFSQRRLQPPQRLMRRLRGLGVNTGSRHRERHDQRGAEPMARYIADHHADPVTM